MRILLSCLRNYHHHQPGNFVQRSHFIHCLVFPCPVSGKQIRDYLITFPITKLQWEFKIVELIARQKKNTSAYASKVIRFGSNLGSHTFAAAAYNRNVTTVSVRIHANSSSQLPPTINSSRAVNGGAPASTGVIIMQKTLPREASIFADQQQAPSPGLRLQQPSGLGTTVNIARNFESTSRQND